MTDDTTARAHRIIEEDVDAHLAAWRNNAVDIAVSALSRCESPIEKLMFAALAFAFHDDWAVALNFFPSSLAIQPGDHILVEPQKQIGAYRADFGISYQSTIATGMVCRAQIVVECDGHDFHEKTKLQAERDKRRDRELAAEGWTVLRFTGSEIVRDPRKCAQSVRDVIRAEHARQVHQLAGAIG